MTNREKFIDYVKNGADKPICSLQIGAGAGFDAKLAGKKWLNETTFEDTVNAYERYETLPLYNFYVDVLTPAGLGWKTTKSEDLGEKRIWEDILSSPHGTLTQSSVGYPVLGSSRTKQPIESPEDWDVFERILDEILNGKYYDKLTENMASIVKTVGERGAIDFQWGMQPYELFSYPSNLDTMLFSIDYEERFTSLMQKCLEISKKIVNCVSQAGGDFCFLGGPAAEMVNPYIYENFIVPYGKAITDEVHKKGMLVYSHVCSPIEPFLTNGYFNQMGIDLFETLSPPPVGNVKSIEDAFSKIDNKICTRGNVGIDVLINGTPDEVRQIV